MAGSSAPPPPPPWNPSPPPQHNSGANYHPWDGFRFILVKLDNFSLHLQKPRWKAYTAYGSASQVSRFNGSAGMEGAGYDDKLAFDRGVSCSGTPIPTSGHVYQGISCPLTTLSCVSCNTFASACIPWYSTGQMTASGGIDHGPAQGWLTMMDCEAGHTAGDPYSPVWGNWHHIAHPQIAGCVCGSTTGGDLKYAKPASEMHAGTLSYHTKPSASGQIINAGKGAYNDSLWYHDPTFSGNIPFSLPSSGSGVYGPPSTTMHWNNKSVYASAGINCADLVDASALFWGNEVRIDQAGTSVTDTTPGDRIESGDCPGSNMITGMSGLGDGHDSNRFGKASYYAVIVFPTSSAMAADPGSDPIITDTTFCLHQDMDSVAMQKVFGPNHHLNGYPLNFIQGITGLEVMHVGPVVNSVTNANGDCDYGDCAHMAYSNTGVMHNLMNNPNWTGGGNPVSIPGQWSTPGVTDGASASYSYAGSSYADAPQMIGGILDGEFARLDDDWWVDNGSGGTNPWDTNLLTDFQKAIIVEAAFQRYDPALTPSSIEDKMKCIFVTKTPAEGTDYNGIMDMMMMGLGPTYMSSRIEEVDNPYFNLHITRDGTTVVLQDVATGFQDKGQESEISGVTYSGGIDYCYGIETNTIAGQYIKDAVQNIGVQQSYGYPTWFDAPKLITQTAGFDCLVPNEFNFPAVIGLQYQNLSTSTTNTGTCRFLCYSFDARVWGKASGSGTLNNRQRRNVNYLTTADYDPANWPQLNGLPWLLPSAKRYNSLSMGFGTSGWNTPAVTDYGGAAFTDQNYEITYMGFIETSFAGGTRSWAYPPGVPPSPGVNGHHFGSVQSGFLHGQSGGESIYCMVTDGNVEWPDNFVYSDPPIPTHEHAGLFTHSNIATNNEWCIRTGNGLFYNSNAPSGCPNDPGTFTVRGAACQGGNYVLTTASGTAMQVGPQTVSLYNAGGTLIDGASYNGAAGYTHIFNVPATFVGYITWSSPDCIPNAYWNSGPIDISTYPANPNLEFDMTAVAGTNPTTCSSGDGTAVVTFSASNVSGANAPGSNYNYGLSWVLYEDCVNSGAGPWTYVAHDHPFISFANGGNVASNYLNGLTGTGVMGGGATQITLAGASVSGVDFDLPNNLNANCCYKVIMWEDDYFINNYSDPSTVPYSDFVDPNVNGYTLSCISEIDFCLTCSTASCSCSLVGTPACHQNDDEDNGNLGVWTGAAIPNGYVNGSAPWQPTDVGSATCTVTPGVAPYSYTWINSAFSVVSTTFATNAVTDTIHGMPPDTYSCTVADSAGNTFFDTIVIPAPTAMGWANQPTSTNGLCGSNGTITANSGDATTGTCGGAASYALSLNNTATWDTVTTEEWVVEEWNAPGTPATWSAATPVTWSVPPGTYYVWAKSSCNCAIPSAAIVISPGANLSATIANSAAACTGAAGVLTVTVASGTAPYSYAWTTVITGANGVAEPGFTAPATTSATYTQATIGAYDYEVVVTDSGGCAPVTLAISTTSAGALTLTAIVSQIGCSGGTGSIDTTVTGGTAAYSYQWSGSSTATTADLSGISAGTYTLVVTDAAGCTTTATYVIASTAGLEAFIDLNHYEYNTLYGLPQTGTAYEDAWYGKYGGPTCPTGDDGTIRLILDSTSGVAGAAFPYNVEISNDGGATYWPVRNNAGTVYTGANGLTTTDGYDTGTGFLTSTGVAYDHITDGMVAGTYFELQGGTGGDEWNPGGGYVDLPFTAGSTWDIRLTENGSSPPCYVYVSTTILDSDYQNVDVGDNVASVMTPPSCCGCSSYGAGVTNVCDGSVDITPTLGTYEDHTNITYTYLWSYTGLATTCGVAGHVNVNTMWSNLTTQDITAEWPGVYEVVVTDSCSGTDTESFTLPDPIVYIDDITWTHPLCADCCDGTITITAHGGSGNLEVSVDNRATWQPMTSNPYVYTGLCDGIFNIWVRDDSFCGVEYFADPDDAIYGASFDEHCFADADITGILTTSGTWTPTSNSNVMTTPTNAAFTGTAFTRIQLTAVSSFTAANACVTSHNLFPGGTDGEITLNLVGGNAPYTITVQTVAGPVYNPITGLIPCAGIGPLPILPDPCTLTGLTIPSNNVAATTVITVTENSTSNLTQFNAIPVTGLVTNDTSFTFEQVSVSRDLNSSALGAGYIFYVQDSTGCVQNTAVGMDNGMFNLVSIYGAENCDCICPLGFTLDTDPGSPTFEDCVSNIINAVCHNGTTGYWTLSRNMMNGGIVPAAWGALGGALYGPWIAGAVNYGMTVSLDMATLPLKKNIVAITANLLYDDNTNTPKLGVDLGLWTTLGTTSYINNRLNDNAIWLTQTTWPITPPPPPIPTGEWIGTITDVNFATPINSIICMASNEKMRMKVDGVTWIEMDGDDTIPGTTTSNEGHYNMFPIILPLGIHTISFEVYNTNGHGFMAYDIISSTMSSGNFFVAECLANTYSQAFHEANLITDANGKST